MGSVIEVNDTLKLERNVGFPRGVEVGKQFTFTIPERRLFNLKPVRVFLVEEVAGKWNFVGHAMIVEQTIDAERNETRGKFEVALVYPPEHREAMNRYEAPTGKGLVAGT